MAKKFFISLLFCGVVLVLPIISGCTALNVGPAANQAQAADPVVAQINEFELYQSQLDREMAFDRAIHYLTTGHELTRQDPEEKLSRLVTTELIDQQAREAGITSTEADVTAALDAFVQQRRSSVADLEAALRRQGQTLSDFKATIARTVRTEKFLATVVLAGAATQVQQQEKLAAWLKEIQGESRVEILYSPPESAPTVGAKAPDFTLLNLEGQEVSLSQFKGRPVVVNFWATWCVPCRREMPAFQQAFEAHQADNLVILAINLEESASQVEPFVEELGLTFEILYDSQGTVNKSYLVSGLPRTIFIDRNGIIQHIQVGELQEVFLQGFLGRILD